MTARSHTTDWASAPDGERQVVWHEGAPPHEPCLLYRHRHTRPDGAYVVAELQISGSLHDSTLRRSRASAVVLHAPDASHGAVKHACELTCGTCYESVRYQPAALWDGNDERTMNEMGVGALPHLRALGQGGAVWGKLAAYAVERGKKPLSKAAAEYEKLVADYVKARDTGRLTDEGEQYFREESAKCWAIMAAEERGSAGTVPPVEVPRQPPAPVYRQPPAPTPPWLPPVSPPIGAPPQGSAHPPARVCVVLGTYNRLHHLQRAINSVRRASKEVDLRFAVVDGGSVDGTLEWLEEQTDVELIQQELPLTGAVAAFNLGFGYAVDEEFPYVVHLNDDAEIVKGTLLDAIEMLRGRKSTGEIAFAFDLRGGMSFDHIHDRVYANFGMVRREAGMAAARAQGDPDGRLWWSPRYRTYGADSEFGCWMWKSGWDIFPTRMVQVHDCNVRDAMRAVNEGHRPDADTFWRRWPDVESLRNGPRP